MIKVGIIGMGFGRKAHLPAILSIPGLIVSALADSGSKKALETAKGINYPVQVFHDGLDLINNSNVDLVIIATPPQQQFSLVEAALVTGKHVICEKPFGCSSIEAEKLYHLEKISSGKIIVGYEFPHDAAFRTMIDLTTRGELGELQRIYVRWLTSGASTSQRNHEGWKNRSEPGSGLLNDWCCHIFDYSQKLINSRIVDICCRTKEIDNIISEVYITCSLANEAIGQFTVSNQYSIDLGHKINLIGRNGSLKYQHLPPYKTESKSLTHFDARTNRQIQLPASYSWETAFPDNRIAALRVLIGDFTSKLEQQIDTDYSHAKNALKIWEIIAAAQRSRSTGCLEIIK